MCFTQFSFGNWQCAVPITRMIIISIIGVNILSVCDLVNEYGLNGDIYMIHDDWRNSKYCRDIGLCPCGSDCHLKTMTCHA